MKYTDAKIEEAAGRFEALAHSLDPDGVIPDDLSDLRAIAEAAEQECPPPLEPSAPHGARGSRLGS
jgi:hypothetical protein